MRSWSCSSSVLVARIAAIAAFSASQRCFFLDMLAVLVERRRADRVQLAAGEHRLEQVARVHRALGRAGTDDGVQLVDEQDDLALAVLDLLQDRLEPLLELAT